MTNSKVRNSDSAYSICFTQVLLKLFTFLINTAYKRYTTFIRRYTTKSVPRVFTIERFDCISYFVEFNPENGLGMHNVGIDIKYRRIR